MPANPHPAELARIRSTDPALASLVEDALEHVTVEGELATTTLYGLQNFLWYELPFKWMLPSEPTLTGAPRSARQSPTL